MSEDLNKKEGLSSEEVKQKRQLYKNWKLYAAALGIVTIGLSVGLGVGLATTGNSSVTEKKIDLSKLAIKTTIDLSPDDTILDVERLFDKFLQENSDIANDLKNGKNIEIKSYILPKWNTSGWIEIIGTGKYKGTLIINFPAWQQIDLSTLKANALDGNLNMTQDDAFAAFLANNQDKNLSDLKANVDLSFVAPGYDQDGWLLISAKSDTKYMKEILITIKAVRGLDLSVFNSTVISGTENMTQDDAFAAFLANNQEKNLSDLKANVDLSFVAPKKEKVGSLIISVNKTGKYFGTITLVISKWGQQNINELNLNLDDINGIENMTQDDAFAAFLANNQDKNLSDLKANVDLSFVAPGYAKAGSLIITGTATGKYSGKISITIVALGQTNLNDLTLELNLTEVTNQDDAFAQFLNNNQEQYPDLRVNVEIGSFIMPTYNIDGRLVVIARTDIDNKYCGSIIVVINKISRQNLAELNLVKSYDFDKGIKKAEIFEQFIKLNQEQYPDLRANVEVGTLNNNGTLEIKAKPNGKYFGSIIFNFTGEIIKTDLSTLNLQKEINDVFIVQDKAFEAFLNANSNVPDLRDSVEVISFINSKYQKAGSLTIAAKPSSDYKGTITISLAAIGIPIDLKKFDGYQAGTLKISEDSENAIKDAIINKIIELAEVPADLKNTISSAISIEINATHTSALIKGQGLIGSIGVRNQARIYFTPEIK